MTTALKARPGSTKRWNALEWFAVPAELLTGVEQALESRTAAHRIRHRQRQAFPDAVEFALRFGGIEFRGVQTDARAANVRVGEPAERYGQLDDLFDRRQREIGVAQHVRAPRLVADHEPIGLAAVQ